MTVPRKRLDIGPEECKALDIALRTALGLSVTQSDATYLASPTGMAAANTVWAKVNAFRNFYHATGAYTDPLYVPCEPDCGHDHRSQTERAQSIGQALAYAVEHRAEHSVPPEYRA